MKQIVIRLAVALLLVLAPMTSVAVPAYAACGNSPAAQQVYQGIDQTASGKACSDSGVQTAISAAVNILSLIIGALAIIVIILSGFKYITSGGDSGKVGNAKGTLLYALIGLAVAALAQLLVHFVLYQSNKVAGG